MCYNFDDCYWIQSIGMSSPYGDCEPSSGYIQTKCLAKCKADYVIGNCNCRTVDMLGDYSLYLCMLTWINSSLIGLRFLWMLVKEMLLKHIDEFLTKTCSTVDIIDDLVLWTLRSLWSKLSKLEHWIFLEKKHFITRNRSVGQNGQK